MIGRMLELIAMANQAILESQMLRREGRSLRFEASILAGQLGQTIRQSQGVQNRLSETKASLNQMLSDP